MKPPRDPAEAMYRPGFSGHKMLLRGRPDWGACGEPFASGLSRAAVGILLQQPVLVIARDEGPDRGANLLGIAENPAPHDLLLEGADEALRHTVGLGLADEGKARRHERKAIWFWKWSDIKALPWSWRSRRPRAASARSAPQALATGRALSLGSQPDVAEGRVRGV